jgi:aspartate racemase
MKTLGIIGGMSWESTASYYTMINKGIREHFGGLHSAPLLISSYDFAEIEQLQSAGRWAELGAVLTDTARKLEEAGAEGLLIATNTMHGVADEVAAGISVPLLNIADALGEALVEDGIGIVGLLGTRFTMENPFYAGRLKSRFGIDVIVPDEPDRNIVHMVIYDELCCGITRDASRDAYIRIIEDLKARGAWATALACTEIGQLIGEADTDLLMYDTTRIHAEAAVRWIIGKKSV